MGREHQERVIQDSGVWPGTGCREQETKTRATGEGEAPSERREYGFIAVSSGEGLSGIFRGIGADCLIEGGQTMNPSTEGYAKGHRTGKMQRTFSFCFNNKNIIMAAQQARDLTEDKNIIVNPLRTKFHRESRQ